ncbi:MAG: fluoride efflux transporter CrcB [Desulfovibrio sp.]|nr:fluoride efflux transporter CrcB [Desulfovibrio sp.]
MSGTGIAAICVGAVFGALLRWGIGSFMHAQVPNLPLGTLLANLSGGYLVGLVVGVFTLNPALDPAWRLGIVTGFLGALTSFSTFSLEMVLLIQQERILTAASMVGLHVGGSLCLTVLGLKSVKLLRHVVA